MYCSSFSRILNDIKEVIKEHNNEINCGIVDRDFVKMKLSSRIDDNNDSIINGIIKDVRCSVTIVNLNNKDIRDVIWELTEKVLNAIVGDSIKKYREDVLYRLNTVAFRTELAVKSEKK